MEEDQKNPKSSPKNPVQQCSAKIWETFSCYSQESTIHSMNYIGRERLHWIERVFWIIAFLLAALTCTYLVVETYNKWEQDPMIVSFKEKATPTWQIPFPAITICPEVKVDIEKFNFTQILDNIHKKKNLSAEDDARYEALYQVCDISVEKENETQVDISKVLKEIKSQVMSYSYIKVAGQENSKTRKLIKETITSDGVCYTYNMMNYKDLYRKGIASHLKAPKNVPLSTWSAFGYSNNEPFTYPHRIMGAGRSNGVEIMLSIRKRDIDYACNDNPGGFRLTVHAPDEIPDTESNFYQLPLNMRSLISVDPKVIRTSKKMKQYKPKQRQCYFPGEKKLEHFKGYTQANCKLECFSKFLLQVCGCVSFYLPHVEGTNVCGRSKINCVLEAESYFSILEFGREVEQATGAKTSTHVEKVAKKVTELIESHKIRLTDDDDNDDDLSNLDDHEDETDEEGEGSTDEYEDGSGAESEDDDSYEEEDDTETEYNYYGNYNDEEENSEPGFNFTICGCYPACSSIHYAVEMTQSTSDFDEHNRVNKDFTEGDDDYDVAVVTIYFKEKHFIESKRSELYGWLNFLSNMGGLLGLLTGCSFLSLIEILYHLTLRKVFRSHNEAEVNED